MLTLTPQGNTKSINSVRMATVVQYQDTISYYYLSENTAVILPVAHICLWSSTCSSTLWYWSETSMAASQAERVKCGVRVERETDRAQINGINISCSCHLGAKPSCIFMSETSWPQRLRATGFALSGCGWKHTPWITHLISIHEHLLLLYTPISWFYYNIMSERWKSYIKFFFF